MCPSPAGSGRDHGRDDGRGRSGSANPGLLASEPREGLPCSASQDPGWRMRIPARVTGGSWDGVWDGGKRETGDGLSAKPAFPCQWATAAGSWCRWPRLREKLQVGVKRAMLWLGDVRNLDGTSTESRCLTGTRGPDAPGLHASSGQPRGCGLKRAL